MRAVVPPLLVGVSPQADAGRGAGEQARNSRSRPPSCPVHPGEVERACLAAGGTSVMLGGCWQRATRVRRETGGRPGRRGAQRLRLPRAPPLRAATGARTGASEACRNLSQTVQRRLATVGRPRRARQEPWERDRHGRARGLRGALRRLGSDPLSCGRPPPSASLAAGTSTAQS